VALSEGSLIAKTKAGKKASMDLEKGHSRRTGHDSLKNSCYVRWIVVHGPGWVVAHVLNVKNYFQRSKHAIGQYSVDGHQM
jgi:hypothetical protein